MSITNVSHDYSKALEILASTMGDDDRPVGILVGAGCSSSIVVDGEPLIASIGKLTADIQAEISAGPLAPALNALIASFEEDSAKQATIEDWLSRLRTMSSIAGKHSKIRGIQAGDISELEKRIVTSISKRVSIDLPDAGGGFDALARWASATSKKYPLQVFTLNYDLLMEQAFERYRVPYFDGFVGAHRPFLDVHAMEDQNLPSRWARIWKMHGSVNWRSNNGTIYRTVSNSNAEDSAGSLIHPSNTKYEESRRGPYLAMQDRLRSFLREPGASLVCLGYSFGDQHINEIVIEGLTGNTSAVAFAPLYGELSNYESVTKIALRVQNLRLMAADEGVIAGRRSRWSTTLGSEERGHVCEIGDFAKFAEFLNRTADGSEDD